MIALTSISPNHKNNDTQKDAVDSWIKHGFTVYSHNSHAECDSLAPLYPKVKFIPTYRTMEGLFGKPYVAINAMLDFAKDRDFEDVLLINSDIIICDESKILPKIKEQAREGIVVMTRWDFAANSTTGSFFDSGFDGFFINKKHYNIWPQGIYCMGMTHWDYWIPFRAIKEGIPIFKIKEKLLFHKLHPIQYDSKKWQYMSRFFQLENKLDNISVQQVSDRTHRLIKTKLQEW